MNSIWLLVSDSIPIFGIPKEIVCAWIGIVYEPRLSIKKITLTKMNKCCPGIVSLPRLWHQTDIAEFLTSNPIWFNRNSAWVVSRRHSKFQLTKLRTHIPKWIKISLGIDRNRIVVAGGTIRFISNSNEISSQRMSIVQLHNSENNSGVYQFTL